ncbi:calcium homeostasis endoplasmic reticulum protein [Clonorchis sinensis]|uniref:Calcium homeostasis endoplasmic reticulum protein n=1 Tax=Clonorchis sinensis TaxID=79923 RepID=G7YB24_CLOSI|nr:calcium homeostasis endoplasmic reticulum protein [Clonorchis sinensis]
MAAPAPPSDLEQRNIIDKLAEFVARNGQDFESLTKEKQRENPKFAFLQGGDYYDYYKYKVEDFRKHWQDQRPYKENYQQSYANHAALPLGDLEQRNIIDKLAEFVARNGQDFESLTKEKQRENPKFAFLQGGDYYDYYKYKVEDFRKHWQDQRPYKENYQQPISLELTAQCYVYVRPFPYTKPLPVSIKNLQDSVFGPPLSLLCVNDLPDVLASPCVLFADD